MHLYLRHLVACFWFLHKALHDFLGTQQRRLMQNKDAEHCCIFNYRCQPSFYATGKMGMGGGRVCSLGFLVVELLWLLIKWPLQNWELHLGSQAPILSLRAVGGILFKGV